MVKKLLTLLFASVLAFPLSIPVFAQEDSKPVEATPAKLARWEGIVIRNNKDSSTLTVRSRATNVEKTVRYDSWTQWTSQEHGSKKMSNIDASEVKENDRLICLGTWDKDGALHAISISKRLTN